MFSDPQTRFGSVPIAVLKKDTYRMVVDYRAVDNLVAPSEIPLPNLQEIESGIAGASVFCMLDLLQGY